MATSSVAIPAKPGDDDAAAAVASGPAMLDRARGLAAAGIAAAAAAAAVSTSTLAGSTIPATAAAAAAADEYHDRPAASNSSSINRSHRRNVGSSRDAAALDGGSAPTAPGAALLDAKATSTTPLPTPMSPTRPVRPSSHRATQGGRVTKPASRHQTPSAASSSSTTAAALATAAATLSSVSSSKSLSSPSGSSSSSSSSLATVRAGAKPKAPASDADSSSSSSSSSSSTPRSSLRRRGGSNGGGAASRTSSSSSLSSTSSSLLTASSSTTTASSTATAPLDQASSSIPAKKPVNHSKSRSVPSATTSAFSGDHNPASTSSSSSASSAAAMGRDNDGLVFSFWGPEPVPLPTRFSRIKRNLIKGHEAELEACWARLITALRAEVEHIEGLGAHLIPSIEFTDVDDPAQAARFGRDLRRYGVGVIRKVVPKPDADAMVRQTVQYLDDAVDRSAAAAAANGASPKQPQALPQDPTCYDFFWTPAQVRSRAHPGVLRAQRFMMGLWETTPDDRLATRLPITYVDRIRIHGNATNKDNSVQNLPRDQEDGVNGIKSLRPPPIQPPAENPQSADDWITALQSSAGIIAQVDNGSLERWEPDGYQRAGTYNNVFHGRWEDHDPWECASRTSATMDLYNGYGACTIFRMFQGVLALSTIEPGIIRLLPSPKLATAYYLLRPFFSARTPAPPPGVRSGPEWDAYLHPDNWRLEREPDTIIHGAVPGHAQRITEHWHPHLHLRSSMITLPTLQPGDYIFWHPDLPYHISSNNPGLKTPNPAGETNDVSMLVYIPAAPLTQTNALYLARQRKAFQRGNPGPDFDSSGRGVTIEDPDIRPGEKEIAEAGGPAALQAMGLAPWEAAATRAGTPPPPLFPRPAAISSDEDTEMTEADTTSLTSATSGSHAEAEVIRLSNIILFPDRSMLGYSV
ncbi:hypothetical protein HJFPF1_10038 [Paramyrothecium foliicola]|nr:hypothetical protein HJFPF1_10038 [Paramyrothecium foliicola]